MAHATDDLVADDLGAYLRRHEHKSMLRFITCGSVDDGKSTLIGRLLYDSKLVFEDHLAALEADSRRIGTQGEGLDFALLVDGLAAEREQGITIDVAYRFFSTDRRKFIVADTPGHEQYTRNMVTGASTADLAVILVEHLEAVEVDDAGPARPFRLPVQWVNRPDLDFRGFSGRIAGGTIRPGDRVRIVPSGTESTVARIVTADGDLDEAADGQSVTVTLADEVDVSRGDVIAQATAPPPVADQFECHIVWMGEEPMLPGRPYLLKIGTRTVGATVTHPKYKINVNTLEHEPAPTLELNEIAVGNISIDRPIAFDPYGDNRDMGGFILIDRFTNATIGAGLLDFELRRAQNVHWQATPSTATPGPAPSTSDRRWSGSPASPGPASRPSPTSSSAASTTSASTPTSSTGTTSATGSTGTSASPTPTGWRTSGVPPRWGGSWSTPG